MADPWTIAQSFISDLQRQNAQAQNVADNALMNSIQTQAQRTNFGIQQAHDLAKMGQQNEYAVANDTTAFNRQVQVADTAYNRNVADRDVRYERDLAGEDRKQGRARDDLMFSTELGIASDVMKNEYSRRYGPKAASSGIGDLDPTNPTQMSSTVARESGGRNDARNPTSSATGRNQFLSGTWNGLLQEFPHLRAMGIKPASGDGADPNDGRRDAKADAIMKQVFDGKNKRVLDGAGIPWNEQTSYAAHFLGVGDAVKLLSAPDNVPLNGLINKNSYAANKFLHGMTVGDLKRNIAKSHPLGNEPDMYQESSPTDQVAALAAGSVVNEPTRRYSDSTSATSGPATGFDVQNTGGAASVASRGDGISSQLASDLESQGKVPIRIVDIPKEEMDLINPTTLSEDYAVDRYNTARQQAKMPLMVETRKMTPEELAARDMRMQQKAEADKNVANAERQTSARRYAENGRVKEHTMSNGMKLDLEEN